MRIPSPISAPLTRLITVAFCSAFVMALLITSGRDVLQDFLFGENVWNLIFLVGLLTIESAATVLATFTTMLRYEHRRAAASAAFAGLTLGSSLFVGQTSGQWPLLASYLITSTFWIVYGYAATYSFVSLLNVTQQVAWTTATGVAALSIFGACVGYFMRSWIGLETLTDMAPVLRDLSTGMVMTMLFATFAFSKPFRLNNSKPMTALILRLPDRKDRPLMRTAFLLCLGGLFFNAMSSAAYLLSNIDVFRLVAIIPWSWVGLLLMTTYELGNLTNEHLAGTLSSRLTPKAAQKLLLRQKSGHHSWAATVGVRTANFIIDHDPLGYLHQRLPATLLHIRSDEIQRSINSVLRDSELLNRCQGTRVVGALDTEFSLRPCVDTLIMYACLYMDIGPLVERRIKVLADLFPIIDPGLTTRVSAEDVSQLMRRLEWFYYLDFAWTDQHLIATAAGTRFDVSLASLTFKEKAHVLEGLEKTSNLGAQVWLSPEARDRLIQEAPQLRSIISLSPLDKQGSTEETLLFSIRFEHLIPMLQRYFELDQKRRTLLDFEPSQNHSRMINLLNLQLSRAASIDELIEVLTSITTVPWNGYKEKDAALKLILAAHGRLKERLSPTTPLHVAETRIAKITYELIQKSVQKVGYPSQMLHHAQMTKMALRQIAHLIEAASLPRYPRFVEAWLLLASMDFKCITPSYRRDIALFIKTIEKSPTLARNTFVQARIIDAWSNLCRAAGSDELPLFYEVLTTLWKWFIKARVKLDIISHLIDAQIYAMSIHGDLMALDADLLAAVESHLNSELAKLEPGSSVALALSSRLPSLHTKKAAAA